jgi:hypothetical protein
MSKTWALSLIFYSTVLVGCSGECQSSLCARRVAVEDMKRQHVFDPSRPISATDLGTHWLIVFHGRPGWTGGDSRVWVKKRSGKVDAHVIPQ